MDVGAAKPQLMALYEGNAQIGHVFPLHIRMRLVHSREGSVSNAAVQIFFCGNDRHFIPTINCLKSTRISITIYKG